MAKRHIFLTGFMGAGKSKIGKHLAELLQWPFVDTDKEIEKQTGKTVRQIFEQDGEVVFRELEKEMIRKLALQPQAMIIALGGGALNNPQSFELVHKSGWVVYLKSSPKAILQRVAHSTKRPLLDVDVTDEERKRAILLQRISELLKKRENIYLQANIVLDRDGLEAEQVAEKLLEQIKLFWKTQDGTNRS